MTGPTMQELLDEGALAEERAAADREAAVARRRRRLLWWSAPVVVVALVAAGWLAGASTVASLGVRAYDGEEYPTAVSRFSTTESLNALDSWKPWFNAGTARYASGAFATATTDLERSLALVPRATAGEERGWPECAVATNLGLSVTALGDEAAEAADAAMAVTYYEQALDHIEGCRLEQYPALDEPQLAQQTTAENLWLRLQESLAGAQEEESDAGSQGEDESDGEDGEDEDPEGDSDEELENPTEQLAPDEEDPDAELLGELEERNREAQQGRDEQEQGFGGGSGGGQGW